jgi:6,7-dimethyl-8-ribityllumazine synthase
MASGDERATAPDDLDGGGLRIGVVRSRWNPAIVQRLADGVRRGLSALGVTEIVEESVPGALEIPLGAKLLIASGRVDAVVCIGAVIRGETSHYDLVSEGCATGIAQVQLTTGVPVLFGVLTVESSAQAEARSQPSGGHNVGEEAAVAAVEMARLSERLSA